MKCIAKSVAFTAVLLSTSVVTAGTSAQLPLQDGDLVATSFPGFLPCCWGTDPDPLGFSLTLVDVRIPPVVGAPPSPGVLWNAPMFNNAGAPPSEIWNAENLGLVFGVCFDAETAPNIYAAATSNAYGDWSAFPFPMGGVGPDGTGAIYKIDGVTADINSWVMTAPTFTGGPGTNRIPTDGPGVGQVCHNPVNDEFFATNFEDGQIYRIDNNGIIIDTYDPFAPNSVLPAAFAKRGERPWAVEVHNGRLYFSVWLRDLSNQAEPWNPNAGTAPPNPNNSIWSYAIDPGGALVGSPVLEIVMPYINTTTHTYSNPVADIAFSDNGDMLCGERVMLGDYGMIDTGHQARCLEFNLVSGVWQQSTIEYFIGSPVNPASGEPENCAGGVDYDCDHNVWSGGDVIGPAGYGIQSVPSIGNSPTSPISTSYIIPFPHQLKAGMGDVDYYRTCSAGCEVACEPDDFPEDEPCGTDVNHGCDFDPPLFTSIRCGYNVCGNLWALDGDRDTDWYAFQVGDGNGDGLIEVHARITSQVPVAIRLHDGCTEIAIAYADTCETVELIACVPVPPSMYFISVKPELPAGPIVDGYPCEQDYRLETWCFDVCDTGEPGGPCVMPPANMVAWWPYDETSGTVANDVVFGNDGAYVDFPTPMPGMVDFSLDFDGISQFVGVLDNPVLNFGPANPGTTDGDFSIDAWINIDSFVYDHSPIVDKRQNGIGYYFAVVDGELALSIEDGTGGIFHGSGGVVPTGEWVHVAVTVDRDNTNGIQFYVNGAVSGSDDPTGTSGSLTIAGPLHMGGNFYNLVPGDGQAFFDGRIDEVEIFNRVLANAEVFELWNAGSSGKCKHCCTVPSAVSFCNGADSVTVKIQVCNKSATDQTYNVSIAGLSAAECGSIDGPTGFTFIDSPIVTLAPGDCTAVRVKIDRPVDMLSNGDTACYEACVENLANGQIVCCRGKLVDRRKWCAVAIPNDDMVEYKVGISRLIAFEVHNIDRPGGVMIATIHPQFPDDGGDGGTTPPVNISLDGLPPGEPVVRKVKIPPGEIAQVEVEVAYIEHSPLEVHEIAFKADFDGDGVSEATLATVPVRVLNDPPCTGDSTGDGQVNVTDVLGMLAAWGTANPTYDIAPAGGDGVVDIQDLLDMLSQWGSCP